MPKPPHQIQQELEAIEADIPQFIKTGIPANVKSDKHRSLEQRANVADQDLLEHIVAFYDNMGMVIAGFGDPNENPPTEDYGIGQLFLQLNQSTSDSIALWIFTGTPDLGWWKFQNFEADTATKYYGDIANPNTEPIPDLPSVNPFKIGDYYVKTSTGTSSGGVESVWIFLGLSVGNQWVNMVSSGGGTAQVNSDWNATSGVEEILNKPTIPSDINELNDTDNLLFSGDYNDLTNKPTIPEPLEWSIDTW